MTADRRVLGLGMVAAAALLGGACSPAAAPDSSPIATLHARQCGRCHTAPQPGTRSREHLGEALAKHHKRVKLTDEQWAALVDYLAGRTD